METPFYMAPVPIKIRAPNVHPAINIFLLLIERVKCILHVLLISFLELGCGHFTI